MSLRVWLPLNGDLTNNGLSNVTVTNNGATVDNNGKIGKCYSFDGTNDYMFVSPSFLSNSSTEWSYCCWMKLRSTQYGCLFCDRTTTSASGLAIFYYGRQWLVDDGTRWQFNARITLNVNTWYHITVVIKKGVGKYLYVNGELDSSTTTTGTPTIVNTTRLSIGASMNSATTANANYFSGYLNDVRIYDHALSAKEVKELSKGLVLHYKLNDNYFNTVYDCSGYCRNATKYGNITTSNSTPRNSLSTVFPDNTSYILLEDFSSADFANSYTFSWWAKYTYTTQTMMWGYADGNKLNMYIKSKRYYWNSSRDGTQNPFGEISSQTYGDENWHHFTIAGDGTTTKLYIDGEFKANATTYRGINGTSLVLNGYTTGTSYKFNGSLSDFRIYATALSVDDIKELYQIGASIDKDGNVFAYEFKED